MVPNGHGHCSTKGKYGRALKLCLVFFPWRVQEKPRLCLRWPTHLQNLTKLQRNQLFGARPFFLHAKLVFWTKVGAADKTVLKKVQWKKLSTAAKS